LSRSLAQDVKAFRIGPKIGLTNTVLVSQLGSYKSLYKFAVGVAAEHRLTQHFSLSYEFFYGRQGGYYSVTGLVSPGVTGTDRIYKIYDVLNFPVLVRFYPKERTFFVEAGGQFGYVISNEDYYQSNRSGSYTNKDINRTDFSLLAGVGYNFGKKICINFRYCRGRVPIYPSYDTSDPTTGVVTHHKVIGIYNRVLSLNLTYFF
jgi:hypothetical protein